MSITEPDMTEIIIKHLQGKSSESEQKSLEQWLNEKPENLSILQDYKRIWKETGMQETQFQPNVESAWQNVKMKANLNTMPADSTQEGALSRRLLDGNLIWKIAASFAFLAGLAYLLFSLGNANSRMVEIAAKDKMEIVLPDSTLIALNKGAKIRYQEDFLGQNDRVVYLEGEAFFNVKRNEKMPFIVNGKTTETKVLGTSFNVKVLAELEETTVLTGKVSFSLKNKKESLILIPGNTGRITENNSLTLIKANENAASWKTGNLKFDNATLAEVADDLEMYFNTPVDIDQKIQNYRFTGTFTYPDLEEILTIITVSTDTKFVEKDSTYIISGPENY